MRANIFKRLFLVVPIVFQILASGCTGHVPEKSINFTEFTYDGNPTIQVNDNIPFFTEKEKASTKAFENYSKQDSLGRCGAAYANICQELMPTEERGEIGKIKPTGWKQAKYEGLVNSEPPYLYNRCHLIAFCLAGENANEKNLITGTRYLNIEGMFPYEKKVANYVDNTGNHVLYRVTPFYEGNNLLASGVEMEAYSVEDNGKGICFNVYCFNVQPGVAIDYATGDNWLDEAYDFSKEKIADSQEACDYVININSWKFHLPDCGSVSQMKEKNKKFYTGSRESLIEQGYAPCKACNP